MTEPLTDKQIAQFVTRTAISCPNCEGPLGLHVDKRTITDAERHIVVDLCRRDVFRLEPIELSLEMLKAAKDTGGLDPADIAYIKREIGE